MINVLRLIAYILIFTLHTKGFMPGEIDWRRNLPLPDLLYTPAWAGTWIFFTLSGYGIGAGFLDSRYDLTPGGILTFYKHRMKKILPVYLTWIITVSIFVFPELMMPRIENASEMLHVLCLFYQEEYLSEEFGLAWYLTTLVRLYLLSPLLFIIVKKLMSGGRRRLYAGFVGAVALWWLLRILDGYRIYITGKGAWTVQIYKPFYFNIDFFMGGMIVYAISECSPAYMQTRLSKILSVVSLATLIPLNCYIYYHGYYDSIRQYMDIYCYVFPSLYLIIISWILVAYRNSGFRSRAADAFRKIQYPCYLFHPAVLASLRRGYETDPEPYDQICAKMGVPLGYYDAVQGIMFTVEAFILTLVIAYAVSHKTT